MNKQTLKTIVITGGTCIFMGGALLTGMHLYAATLQDAVQYQVEETETEHDEAVVLAESEKEQGTTGEPANGKEPDYSKIPVIDTATFYHLTGADVEEDGSPMEFDPEEKPRENEISREEAALKGLKEIYRIFGEEEMEEMTLELELSRDKEMEALGKQKESIWAGQLVFLDEWQDADPATLEHNYSYNFEFSSVTGRWLSCEKRQMTRGKNVFGEPEEKLTRGERLDKAFDLIYGYDLLSLAYSPQELKEMERPGGSGVYDFYSSYLVEDYDFYEEPDERVLENFYAVLFDGFEDDLVLDIWFDVETNALIGYHFTIPYINLFL